MMTFLLWFKTKAGLINLVIYLVIILGAYLAGNAWKKDIEEKAIAKQANAALTLQLDDLTDQLERERKSVARLKTAKERVAKSRVDSETYLEEHKDANGNITPAAVASVLCARNLAEPEACRQYTNEPD